MPGGDVRGVEMALELTPDFKTDDAAASAGAVAMNEAQDFDAMEDPVRKGRARIDQSAIA